MSSHRLLRDLFLDHNNADIPDPGDAGSITVDRQLGHVALVSAGAETRTLPNPEKAGLVLLLYMKTDGGDITLTVTDGFDSAANTTLTFADAGDSALLVSIQSGSNYRWRLVGGAGIAAPNQQAALTAADASAVDTTYGQQEADVISNLRTRVGEIEAALEALGLIAAN